MADTITIAGTFSKVVASRQEECHPFSWTYQGEELCYQTFVIPQVDATELSTNAQVFDVDLGFMNVAPPTDNRIYMVLVEVLTSGKRVEVKANMPQQILDAMAGGNPATTVASGKFMGAAYIDVNGALVRESMLVGGKIDSLCINRFPLLKTGKDTSADSGDCKVSVRVIGG